MSRPQLGFWRALAGDFKHLQGKRARTRCRLQNRRGTSIGPGMRCVSNRTDRFNARSRYALLLAEVTLGTLA